MRQLEAGGPGARQRDLHIGEVAPVPALAVQQISGPFGPQKVEMGEADEDQQEAAVVQRKDPESAPQVEVAEEPRAALGVQQDARDEEARQHEKEVHPDPTSAGLATQQPFEWGG